MRKAQKNGLRKVKHNSDIQQIRKQIKHESRKKYLAQWQDPTNFRSNAYAQVTFKGYKTPKQIKARVKKMKGKKVKGKISISSLWS
jgi:NCAIR mutase (PurE)-related protein|tara:strand:+ start:881 stop:1138 length:258 start_codon:yes stop_codon:yes gene_type:complete